MFGAHLSIAGGLENALEAARRQHMDCVQIFTANQRRWSMAPLSQAAADAWKARLREMSWDRRRPPRAVSHASYLINIASPDRALHRRSAALLRLELERCEALSIPLCVLHPGAHLGPRAASDAPLGSEPTRAELAGLKRAARGLDRVHRDLPGLRVVTCLETTAGAGTTLGYDFRHLAIIAELVREPQRLGFCLDTCHVTAAGYDMTRDDRAARVLGEFDRVCGLGKLRVLHLNDSLGAVGSRRDRHAHIGHGYCGLACFRALVNSPRIKAVPKILETPKGTNERGVDWDVVNIRRLRRLQR